MFDHDLTGGSKGNISPRTEDSGLLVSSTGTSFGRLDAPSRNNTHRRAAITNDDPVLVGVAREAESAPA